MKSLPLVFSKSGPKQTRRQLLAVERRLDVDFPNEFRDFLLKHNGGVPKPNTLRPVKGEVHAIEFFYAIGGRASERDLVKMTEYCRDELDLPHHYLPVALSSTQDLLLLHVAGRSAGKVDWWTVISEGFDKRRVSRYCRSFSDLLERFEPQTGAANPADFERLFEAIKEGKKREIKELLQRVDLTALSREQVHPVIQAVYGKDPAVLRLLMEQGVSTKVKDPLGKPAMAIARENQKLAKRLAACYGTPEYARQAKLTEEIVALLKNGKPAN
jgi:hypothetical protein